MGKGRAKKGEPGYYERETDSMHKSHMVIESPEEFTALANAYFEECDKKGQLYGEAGLCLYISTHNDKKKPLSLRTMQRWYDGTQSKELQPAVELAYLRIQSQIESDERYREKGGMATRAIFLQKQARLGGYQDRMEQKNDTTVHLVFGKNMNDSDFE